MFQRENLLILAKTYPDPSTKYSETTCVAALTRLGTMKRIYPVPFRLLGGTEQFKKWEWINVATKKANNDLRPESYKIDLDSGVRRSGEWIDTKNNWALRRPWIEPHIAENFEALEQRRQKSGETLGIIRPERIVHFVIKANKELDWTEKEKNNLTRQGLFDVDQNQRPLLKKLPVSFYYEYECKAGDLITTHRHKVTDWEAGALYWNCVRSHGPNWEEPFRQKMEHDLPAKDLMFLMGTIHRFPNQWLIVGLIYPPKIQPSSGQLTLL